MAAVTWLFSKKSRRGIRPLNVSTSGTGTGASVIAAPGAGIAIVVDSIAANADTDDAVVSIFADTDETGNRLVYNKFKAGGGIVREWAEGRALPANKALKLTASAGNVYYVVEYHLETVS